MTCIITYNVSVVINNTTQYTDDKYLLNKLCRLFVILQVCA